MIYTFVIGLLLSSFGVISPINKVSLQNFSQIDTFRTIDSAKVNWMKSFMISPMTADTIRSGIWKGEWVDMNIGMGSYEGEINMIVDGENISGNLTLTRPGQHQADVIEGKIKGSFYADSVSLVFSFTTKYSRYPDKTITMKGTCVKQYWYKREIVGDTAVADVPYLYRTFFGTFDDPEQTYFIRGFFYFVNPPQKRSF